MARTDSPPVGLRWRSSTRFIIATVTIGLFTDIFLYGIIVPVVPYVLRDRLHIPANGIQHWTSILLAAFSGASLLSSLPTGIITDRLSSRKLPFILGLISLFLSTVSFTFGPSLPWLVSARILQGISGAVVWTVGLTLAMDTVGSANLGATIGTIFSIMSVGEFAAPLLGGLLYKTSGSLGVFALSVSLVAIDMILRLVLIEKGQAAEYGLIDENLVTSDEETLGEDTPSEDTPLLTQKEDLKRWKLSPKEPRRFESLPVIYCLSDSRLLVAFLFTAIQGTLLGTFDATLPTEVQGLYGFNSMQAGLLFAPLVLPNLILGSFAGKAVDKYGTKITTVLGMIFLTITLNLLRIPKPEHGAHGEVIKLCVILMLNSVGFAIIGSPSLVEASNVIEKYHKANKDLFGKKGPYAQLYSLNSMFFNSGLTFGPMLAGILREKVGYANMNSIMSGFCVCMAILSYMYVEGKPKALREQFSAIRRKWPRQEEINSTT